MALNVYYLDDEPELCENFSDYFNSPEIKVTTFTDPKKFIETTRNHPPHLIFLDYRLPETTGDQVAQKLDPKLPKCLITGDISVDTTYKFIKVLSKPCKEEEISNLMSHYQSLVKGS